jgi:hypothetical protein
MKLPKLKDQPLNEPTPLLPHGEREYSSDEKAEREHEKQPTESEPNANKERA